MCKALRKTKEYRGKKKEPSELGSKKTKRTNYGLQMTAL